GAPFAGHTKVITGLALSHDSALLASASGDDTIKLWADNTMNSGHGGLAIAISHEKYIRSISFFSNGRRMISGSWDKTACRWDLRTGKEIEEARDGHSRGISCVDISPDSKLVVSGSWDRTSRIWNLGTGELVAGPFESIDWVGAVRFSSDSKKLAVKSEAGKCLEVWDFDALTLEIVGAPFEGHSKIIRSLALSSDGVLLASAAEDNTIKLWAFEPRQLLASFHVGTPSSIILSPNSRQLAYATGRKIYICNTPLDILISTRCVPEAQGSVRIRRICVSSVR
ncbi:WD40-repeat-containing domain protein, partial [Suillus paluster]|uniref:WD40-repeat-containing domain protein n=1 Tax=Suillus paluster TaxID=48578 RepID=UPI001B87581F